MKKLISAALIICLLAIPLQSLSFADSAARRVDRLAIHEKGERETWGKVYLGLGSLTLIGIAAAYKAPDPNDPLADLEAFVWIGVAVGVLWLVMGANGLFFDKSNFERIDAKVDALPENEREDFSVNTLRIESEKARQEREGVTFSFFTLLNSPLNFVTFGIVPKWPLERPVEKEYREYLEKQKIEKKPEDDGGLHLDLPQQL
jgi:hypothetical protein